MAIAAVGDLERPLQHLEHLLPADPPRWRPAPPESVLSRIERTRSGYSLSTASVGVHHVGDVGLDIVDAVLGRPRPHAAAEQLEINIRAASERRRPEKLTPCMLLEQARTRSGAAWARQPKITSVMRHTVMVRALSARMARIDHRGPRQCHADRAKAAGLLGRLGSVMQRTQ